MSKEKGTSSGKPSSPAITDGKIQVRNGAVKGNTLPTFQAPPPPPPSKKGS